MAKPPPPPPRPTPIHPKPGPSTPPPKPGPKTGWFRWARTALAVAELTASLATFARKERTL